jgi:cytochrome bd ubiquinol oxidase subunit II
MTTADIVLGITWTGLTAYALFAGADFGGGFWDLVAGGAQRGSAQRNLIEHVIGPVWEANHVWLIFVLVVLWTCFPPVIAAIGSTLYIPLTGAGLGIILRGAGFAFRKAVEGLALKRLFGATFALSSVVTPFFLGAIAGGVASGRVPPGNATGDIWASWLNPTSVLGGTLAVVVCANLAAVFLTRDAQRHGRPDLAEGFRKRGLLSGAVAGLLALGGIGVLMRDAPALFSGLTGRSLPLIVLSAVAGAASLLLLWRRRYILARPAAALAVTAVVWGWAVAQYPYMLARELTVAQAAAGPATLSAVLVTLLVGAALVVPALVWLYALFQSAEPPSTTAAESPEAADVVPQTPTDGASGGGLRPA